MEMPKTKPEEGSELRIRSFTVDDETWEKAQEAAQKFHISLSAWIRFAMWEKMQREVQAQPPLR